MKLFTSIIKSINEFLPDDPITLESQLEEKLKKHLEKHGFFVTRQKIEKENRYDLICSSGNQIVCIELKIHADISDLNQFDKYLRNFKDGFIVVCWQASFSVKDIFLHVTEQSPTPIALIELSERYSLA